MNIDKIQFQITGIDGKPLKTKFEMKDKLDIDGDYTILLKGAVFTEQGFSNQDGTINLLYKLAVSDAQVITDKIKKEL